METGIPIITAGAGEIRIRTDKEIDVKCLNEVLLTLPAKTYLGLFREMQKGVYGYPSFVNYGGCCGTVEEKKSDIKIDVDYSEVDEAREKIDELGEKLEEVNSFIQKLTGGKVSVYADFSAIQKAAKKYQQYQREAGKSAFEL